MELFQEGLRSASRVSLQGPSPEQEHHALIQAGEGRRAGVPPSSVPPQPAPADNPSAPATHSGRPGPLDLAPPLPSLS